MSNQVEHTDYLLAEAKSALNELEGLEYLTGEVRFFLWDAQEDLEQATRVWDDEKHEEGKEC